VKVHFFIPPPEQRVGGLDAAIDGMRGALANRGIEVRDDAPSSAGDHVVHFHGIWQPGFPRIARQVSGRGIPYVVSPHGMLEPWAWRHKRWKKWPYFHLIEKPHLARATALLATAAPEAARLRRMIPGPRIEMLPLGITGDAKPDYEQARALLGWRGGERVLLFLSRIHPKKGLDILLRALAGMRQQSATRLVIVGEGEESYVRQLRRFADENAHALPTIDWIGAVWGEARWRFFQGADLFCLPTHSENFGLAVLEACQVGTPALTTPETPWGDELAGGRGIICEPNAESVRRELQRFLSDAPWAANRRNQLADWAWARFHWDKLADRYAEFYSSLL
jgi:glycosyltransferase involved in cell wall biosynthesis